MIINVGPYAPDLNLQEQTDAAILAQEIEDEARIAGVKLPAYESVRKAVLKTRHARRA